MYNLVMVKKLKHIILAICVFLASFCNNKIVANAAETTTYAKALVDCLLYKNEAMDSNTGNVYFVIPETYFVIVLDSVNDNCYKVQYKNYIGYVDASTILIATFIPIVKTLDNICFDIKSTSGTQIWSEPSAKSNICTTLSAGTKKISYISYAFGEVPSGGESNIWYYVVYVPENNSTNVYEGYIYSENTTNLTEIISNFETNPEPISDENENENLVVISSTIKTIVIAIIAIPIILFILIILYKLVKIYKKNTNKNNFQIDKFDDKNNKIQDFEKFHNMKRLKRNEEENQQQFNDENDDELL